MVIQFIYGAKKGAFASAIMAAALNSGRVLRISHPFVSFEVDAWTDFLRIVWTACAECSRDSRGQEIVKGSTPRYGLTQRRKACVMSVSTKRGRDDDNILV